VPASVALLVLADPLVITLYQHGEFGAGSVAPTSRALCAYAVGLVGFMVIKVLASAYFSRQDTRSPVRYGVVAMVANMVMNLALILPLAHVGLALATSLAALLNAGLLLRGLVQRGVLQWRADWIGYLARLALATALMTAALLAVSPAAAQWMAWHGAVRVLWLLLLCGGGGLIYGGVLLATGLRPRDFRG
jgi:putative peptidoglycan lipid II flippase